MDSQIEDEGEQLCNTAWCDKSRQQTMQSMLLDAVLKEGLQVKERAHEGCQYPFNPLVSCLLRCLDYALRLRQVLGRSKHCP